jgi:hypothetical protein
MANMNSVFSRIGACGIVIAGLCVSVACSAQSEKHGRKYQPPPATSHIVVTVLKGFNSKPMESVAVIFHGMKDGHDTGNMEVKTNTQGEATMDFIEAGSHVMVQVFANGYATHAEEFDVTDADKSVLVKLERPRAQVSGYVDNDGKPSPIQPGVQEHIVPKPAPKTPAPSDAGAGSGPQPAQPPQ